MFIDMSAGLDKVILVCSQGKYQVQDTGIMHRIDCREVNRITRGDNKGNQEGVQADNQKIRKQK